MKKIAKLLTILLLSTKIMAAPSLMFLATKAIIEKGEFTKASASFGPDDKTQEYLTILKQSNNNNELALLHASAIGFPEIIYDLIADGTDIRVIDPDGKTPLHCAVQGDHEEVIKLLLDNLASTHIKDFNRRTPLHYAAMQGKLRIVKQLCNAGAHKNARDKEKRNTIHYAAFYGKPNVLKKLIKNLKEKHLNAQDQYGMTPLHLAAIQGDEESCKVLIEKGAKLYVRDQNDNLAVHHAAARRSEKVLKVLLDKDPELIEATNRNGKTPLHIAAEKGSIGSMQLLIDRNANVNCEDSKLFRPSNYAGQRVSELKAEIKTFNKGLKKLKKKQKDSNFLKELIDKLEKELDQKEKLAEQYEEINILLKKSGGLVSPIPYLNLFW